MKPKNKYSINKGFIVQKLGDKTVIFDSEESLLYTFNETASFAFNKLKRGVGYKDLIDYFSKRYNLKKEKAIRDINELLQDLISKKIIS